MVFFLLLFVPPKFSPQLYSIHYFLSRKKSTGGRNNFFRDKGRFRDEEGEKQKGQATFSISIP